MIPPTLREWTYALKTFAAAMLALGIGFWADLDRPYWAMATVYIASQPQAGTTRANAAFRLMGTILGAGAAVALVPNLVDAPALLVAALAGSVLGSKLNQVSKACGQKQLTCCYQYNFFSHNF